MPIVCGKCSTENPETYNFCHRCGNQIVGKITYRKKLYFAHPYFAFLVALSFLFPFPLMVPFPLGVILSGINPHIGRRFKIFIFSASLIWVVAVFSLAGHSFYQFLSLSNQVYTSYSSRVHVYNVSARSLHSLPVIKSCCGVKVQWYPSSESFIVESREKDSKKFTFFRRDGIRIHVRRATYAESDPFFSDDGNFVIPSFSQDAVSLTRVGASGKTVKKETFVSFKKSKPLFGYHLRFSPDGRFVSFLSSSMLFKQNVCIMEKAKSGKKCFDVDAAVALWSKDSRKLFLIKETYGKKIEIFVYRTLKNSFSSLGSLSCKYSSSRHVRGTGFLVYCGKSEGRRDLYFVDMERERIRSLAGMEPSYSGEGFSPDGDWIVYKDGALLKAYNTRRSVSHEIRRLSKASFLLWHPAGDKILVQDSRNKLYFVKVYKREKAAPSPVDIGGFSFYHGNASISPDGKMLALQKAGRENDMKFVVALFDLQGKNSGRGLTLEVPKQNEAALFFDYNWSPDGDTLVLVQNNYVRSEK